MIYQKYVPFNILLIVIYFSVSMAFADDSNVKNTTNVSILDVLPNSSIHGKNSYFYDLMSQLLDHHKMASLSTCHRKMTIDRQFKRLRNSRLGDSTPCSLDVVWAAYGEQVSEELKTTVIPIVLGLNGIRALVIRSSDRQTFAQISTTADLSKFTACQGLHWSDVNVMRENGLVVYEGVSLDSLYKMLARGRCDYFPRGVHEVSSELERYTEDNQLTVSRDVVLRYINMTAFYFRKADEQLYAKINNSLIKMVESGELIDFIRHHWSTKSAFEHGYSSNTVILDLQVPNSPTWPRDSLIYWTKINEAVFLQKNSESSY
jgi:hypothetical protein